MGWNGSIGRHGQSPRREQALTPGVCMVYLGLGRFSSFSIVEEAEPRTKQVVMRKRRVTRRMHTRTRAVLGSEVVSKGDGA